MSEVLSALSAHCVLFVTVATIEESVILTEASCFHASNTDTLSFADFKSLLLA